MRTRGLAVLAAGLCACHLLLGVDTDMPLRDAGGPDGATMDGGDGGTVVDRCGTLGLPPRKGDAATEPQEDRVFALRTVFFGAGIGLNLDKTCTCPGPERCVRPPDAGPACDGDGGVDNALAKLVPTLDLFSQTQSGIAQRLSGDLESGISGALLRLEGYNGLANDDQVTVSVYSSPGFEGFPDAAPGWKGSDRWTLSSESVDGLGAARYKDDSAYVADGVLVAIFNAPVPLVVGGGEYDGSYQPPLAVQLKGGHLVARIEQGYLEGQLAGRWPVKDLLKSVEAYPDPLNAGGFLCGSAPGYQVLQTSVCGLRDIAGDPNADDLNRPCDAISVAVRFRGERAQLGAVVDPRDAGAKCGPQWMPSCP